MYKNIRNISNMYNYADNGQEYQQRQVRLGVKQVDLANQALRHSILPPIKASETTTPAAQKRVQVTKIIRDGRVEAKQLTEQSESQELLNVAQPAAQQLYNLQHFRSSENDMSLLKPVLKRCRNHRGMPVIITFKSFEVWLIQQSSPGNKVHTPIYISLA